MNARDKTEIMALCILSNDAMNEVLLFVIKMIVIITVISVVVIIYRWVSLWLCHCCFEDQHKTLAYNGIGNIGQYFTEQQQQQDQQ